MTAPEVRTPGGNRAFADQKTIHAADFTPDQKRLATLSARAALAGVVLYIIEGDFGKTVYIVSRWNLTRQLDSLDAVQAWLDQVTGARA